MLVFWMSAADPTHERSDCSAGLLMPPYTTLGNVPALKVEFTSEFALEFMLEFRFEFRLEDGLEGSRVGEIFSLAVATASAAMYTSYIIRSRRAVSPLSVGRGPRAGKVTIFSVQSIGITHSTSSRRAC